MPKVFDQRVIIGALIWIGAIGLGVFAMRQSFEDSPESLRQLVSFVTYQRKTIQLECDRSLYLRVGDPVFLAGSDQTAPIGQVASVHSEDGIYSAETTITLFGSSPVVTNEDYVEFHFAPDSVEWMIQTMLPEQKRDEIRKMIQDAYVEHRDEIFEEFNPVIQATMRETSDLVKQELKRAFESRKDKLSEIGNRYQNELLKKELIPLFQNEILPIIEEEGEPLVREIGQEIWNEVSVLSFGWRYLYDKSPLPEKKLTEKKFKEFVDQKAKPILESHTDDFIELQKEIGRKVSANPKVKETISKSLSKVMSDEEIQQLLVDVFKEVTLDNPKFRETIQKQMQSAEAQRAMAIANAKLDPVIRNIGVSLFGNPQLGITPEFARVMRRRILFKDASWLTLHLVNPEANAKLDRNTPFPETLKVVISGSNDSRPLPISASGK